MNHIYGEALLRALAQQAQNATWVGTWTAISFLGSASFFTVLIPALFALASPSFALRFTSRVLLSAWLTELIKSGVGRPRLDPIALGASAPLEQAGLFGNDAFPSGHALMAVVVWVGWARDRHSVPATLAAWLLVVAIACSRLALLRHDLLDVAAGLLLGVLILALLEWLRRNLAAWEQLPWVERAGLWIFGALLALRCLPNDPAAILTGVLAGAGAGVAWRSGRPPAASGPQPGRTLWILVLNLGVIASIRWGAERFALGYPMLLWLLYALGAFWIAGVTPGFRRTGSPAPVAAES